jgi:hypothetical protein
MGALTIDRHPDRRSGKPGPRAPLRSVESLLLHPEVGQRRVQDHRDLLAAFRGRDPDLVDAPS